MESYTSPSRGQPRKGVPEFVISLLFTVMLKCTTSYLILYSLNKALLLLLLYVQLAILLFWSFLIRGILG